MRWKNLIARFCSWFGECVAAGDFDLASRLADVVGAIRDAEVNGPEHLRSFLDELESAELATLEVREPCSAVGLPLRELANEFEAIFRETDGWSRSCGEATVRYVPSSEGPFEPAHKGAERLAERQANLAKLEHVEAALTGLVLAHE